MMRFATKEFFTRFFRSVSVRAATVCVLVFLLVTGLRITGNLETFELAAYDRFIRGQTKTQETKNRILLIGITERDIRALGQWPISDRTLAEALATLLKEKPRAVGLDIFRDIPVSPGHERLGEVLKGDRRIIGVMKFGDEGVPPPPELTEKEQFGFNDVLVDSGGIVRRGLLYLDDGKSVFSSFALRLALLYLRGEGVQPRPDPEHPDCLRLGEVTIRPLDGDFGGYRDTDVRGYQFLIDYKDRADAFRYYSLSDLLMGSIASESIHDKIVIIGVVAQSVKDFFYTPESRKAGGRSPDSGALLHARMAGQLIRFGLGESRPTRTLKELEETAWIFLWGLLGGAAGFWGKTLWRFSFLMAAGILLIFFGAFGAFYRGLWVPVAAFSMNWVFTGVLVTAYVSSLERRQRTQLMELFSRHVSKEIAEDIWNQRDHFLEGGRPRSQHMTVTVLFSDLRGFTAISENMDPESLVAWVNSYIETMAQSISSHGGVVDDYAGDGIKANFGVPVPRKNRHEINSDAVNAIECAFSMEREMRRLNTLWEKRGFPVSGIRVGIQTGEVVAGAIGSSQRLKYTTVGDTVNTAARLESYDKAFAKDSVCRILIGDSTLECLENCYRTEKLGEVTFKGKTEPVMVYQVLGPSSEEMEKEKRG